MLVWDFNSDEVTSGQWLKGHVYTKRADVSPDGRYVVIAASNYSKAHNSEEGWLTSGWTAISRPPYFSALAVWLTGGAWNGGGIWKRKRDLSLNNFAHCWKARVKPTNAIRTKNLDLGPSENEPIYTMRLREHGWNLARKIDTKLLNPEDRVKHEKARKTFLGMGLGVFDLKDVRAKMEVFESLRATEPRYGTIASQLMEKRFARGRLVRETDLNGDSWSVEDETGKRVRSWQCTYSQSQWVDVDRNGRLVFGDKGCLWAWADFPAGQPTLIADLNPNLFTPVAPPDWALQW
jgi:hypothetical protein